MTVQGLGGDPLGSLILDGKKLDARIDDDITQDGPLVRSISKPSSLNLTINDPERYLQNGGYYARRADLKLDDLWFRMVNMTKTGDLFALEFEDREIAQLAKHRKPRRVSRDDATRAEFLRSLVREEPNIKFVCPELHKRQPIESLVQADRRSLADSRRAQGISTAAELYVDKVRAKPSQIVLMNRVLARAQAKRSGERPTLGTICANIGEAKYSNSAHNAETDADGLFQLIPSTASSFGLDPRDVEACADQFLEGGFTAGPGGARGAIELARANPTWTPGRIASEVEGSDANAAYYDSFLDEAKAILKAYGGVVSSRDSDTSGGAYVQRYEYCRGEPTGPKGEDTWACGYRLAGDVAWRWFCVAGVVYLIDDYDLIRSRPRMTLDEDSPGVDTINYSLDDGDRIPDVVTITAHASRWQAPPASVIVLKETMGDAAGGWIVTEIERASLTNDAVTITATKPKAPHREPRSKVARRTGAATAESSTKIRKAYDKAVTIDGKQYPYKFGGGHEELGKPSRGITGGPDVGYDCSGAVSAVLAAGDLLGVDYPLDTGRFLTWGEAGKGDDITVWVNDHHMFMEFTLDDVHVFFEAHHTGTIVGFENTRDTTGFQARRPVL